jgi:hypothetical protein
MEQVLQSIPRMGQIEDEARLSPDSPELAVRFPLPGDAGRGSSSRLPNLGHLFPRRWRRRVVIQGQRFWLPG